MIEAVKKIGELRELSWGWANSTETMMHDPNWFLRNADSIGIILISIGVYMIVSAFVRR